MAGHISFAKSEHAGMVGTDAANANGRQAGSLPVCRQRLP